MRPLHLLCRLLLVVALVSGLTGCTKKKETAPAQLIALLTDYSMADSYVAEMKGAILTINPNAQLIDLTHEIEPFNIMEAAYLLNQASREFPIRTIFVAVVDPGVGTERAPLLVLTKAGKYYIAPNNGILTLVLEREGFAKAWKLDRPGYYKSGTVSATDHGRDIFGPLAAHLSGGLQPDVLGAALIKKDVFQFPYHAAAVNGGNLTGEIWHVDHYGNVITNIPATMAPSLKDGVLMRITLGKQTFSAPLVKTFADVQKGRLAVLIGSQGLLELCVNQGSAAKMLNPQVGQSILIQH